MCLDLEELVSGIVIPLLLGVHCVEVSSVSHTDAADYWAIGNI